MTLDVSVPDPPPQSEGAPGRGYNVVEPPETDSDEAYRRDEIASALADGAWAEGFEEWTTRTDLAESEFELLGRHGFIEQVDFYWDPATEDVGYHVPDLSDDAREALSTGTDPRDIESEVESLARTVAETVAADYLQADGG